MILRPSDGRPGCPVKCWDGPYPYRCGLGADVGRCAVHGPFAPPEQPTPPAPEAEEKR